MPHPHRVLLFGGYGQLGSEIRRLWAGREIESPLHADADITDPEAVARAFEASRPALVVNCAAFHNVERCEVEPAQAFAANAVAVNALAERCMQAGIPFVTFSTDYVFDGELGRAYTERDAPHPISVYAASKYAGELLVARLRSHAYVIRTCGVYGTRVSSTKGYTFIDRIVSQAKEGRELRIVRDQTVSPTYAADLARAVEQLIASGAPPGVYHAVNEGAVTWYEYAAETLRQAGIAAAIEPVSSSEWNSRVRRPAFSALENANLHGLGIRLPSWRDGIAAYLRDKAASAS